ncbi:MULTISPECIES: 2-phosphosulfolactate phosphatase family protein [unclassified Thermotoga]|uniref:2-phosphosulfolactate phosphatase family protein n=1 Tax=unclassified Thermotoga TaxID=2631113 RepID=UPI000280E91F|nr:MULTISPECIES: 2-phosphosulfolactate phosphatase family protein [unclassified Thermotoga]AIY85684.1 2-phosphosulfolactate phosphatase [Thermotoga sp. 2812B]EJX26506.1 2-phosphosulfolactate phosphatase [Thermotoga sp. EMP]
MVDVVMAPCSPVECRTAVVIDVLRATSTIVTALSNGASGVIPVKTIEEALKKRKEGVLICGERNAQKPKGFDLGNSPLEYRKEKISGKTIVLTTTNGTQVIEKIRSEEIIAASFLNLSAVVEYLKSKEDILLVCAGTNGRFSLEDFLLAGAIVKRLKRNDLGDGAHAAERYFESVENTREEIKKHSSHAKRLISLGFENDVEFCTTEDRFKTIPALVNGVFILKEFP